MAPAPFPSYFPLRRPAPVRTATVALGPVRPLLRSGQTLPWLVSALLLLALASSIQAQVAINTTGAAPNPGGGHAMLDLSSVNKGLLAPRVTSAQRLSMLSAAPNTAAARDGLLVYQTDSVGQDPRGYYYYDFSTPVVGWRHIAWGNNWQLGGNANTTASNFLGTVNNMPLVFRTNNQERGRIANTGELQLYYNTPLPAPNERMEVQGGIKLNGGSLTNTAGNIRYTPAAGLSPGKFEGYVTNTPAASDINGWKQIDNNFGERKMQDSPILGVGCADPTYNTLPLANPNNVTPAGPTDRAWPIPGPGGPYGSLTGPQSPYYTVWEDGHRQYLYRENDLQIAGICPGPSNPIRAIAFNASSVGGGTGRIHFLLIRMKNTFATVTATFDMAGLTTFAMPSPPAAGTPPAYAPGHLTGYSVTTGWNVHGWDQGGIGGFVWNGGNLLLDAALDNQEWTSPSIRSGNVQSYNTPYTSMISMFCDACGGNGNFTCYWQTSPPAGFYYPPTTPTNGAPAPPSPSSTNEGWGWTGGWNLTNGVDTRACDGSPVDWQGGGAPSTASQLPRVAFLCAYIGGGAVFNVGSYMYAENGVMIGDAAWAASGAYPSTTFRGPGTISAKKSIWSNTTLLSDYVFDLYYDGTAKPEDAKAAATYQRTPLQDLPNYVERERHLPTVDGRNTWNKTGALSVDKLGNQLWVTVEDQALYIKELNERMDALQQFLVEKKLKAVEPEKK